MKNLQYECFLLIQGKEECLDKAVHAKILVTSVLFEDNKNATFLTNEMDFKCTEILNYLVLNYKLICICQFGIL